MSREDLLSILKQKSREPYYPLIPRLKYTGDKYLLLWHTYNTQHQVFLANSIAQAIELWYIAQREEGLEASAKELWRATIVLPPDSVKARYNEQCYKEDLNNFIWHTCFEIDDYRKRHKKLPPNVMPCKDPEHDNCGCLGGKFVPNTSWDTLFKKDWISQPESVWEGIGRQTKKRVLQAFDGISANPNFPLYVCELNGGHHNRGIGFSEVKADTHFRRGSCLFFFQGEKIQIPTEILDSFGKLKRKEEEKKKQDKRASEERWAKNRRDADESLIRKLSL